jgi:hypothetical protein
MFSINAKIRAIFGLYEVNPNIYNKNQANIQYENR